jgi:cytochrome P450
VWPNPEGFDPLRFERFQATGHAIPGYLPFGDGPRLCIGNNFALTEIQLVLATLVRRFRLDLIPGGAGVPLPLFAVGPRGGMPMRISRRSPSTTAERASYPQRVGSEVGASSDIYQERT